MISRDGLVPLNRLKAGEYARVERVSGDVDHVHRLSEFGVRSGTRVQMFRPGNPCIIRMAGNKVCIRSDRWLRVWVQPRAATT